MARHSIPLSTSESTLTRSNASLRQTPHRQSRGRKECTTHGPIHPRIVPRQHWSRRGGDRQNIQASQRFFRENDPLPSRTHRWQERRENKVHLPDVHDTKNTWGLLQARRDLRHNQKPPELLQEKSQNPDRKGAET